MDKVRVVLAEKDELMRRNLKDILTASGYLIVGEAEDGITALQMIRTVQPEIVLTALDLPAKSGLELVKIIDESRLAAVILIVDYAQREFIQKAEENWSIPVLVRPFDQFHLISLLEYSYSTFNKMVGLEREIDRLKTGLESRKTIEKAKGILMRIHGLNEEEAFKKIQQQSMRKRATMKNIAEAIIMTYEISNNI